MNAHAIPMPILLFLSAVVVIPIIAALFERLLILSGQRKEISRVIRPTIIVLCWLLTAINILESVGFEFLSLIRALTVIMGVLLVFIVAYGFGKDVLIGLMLASDSDFQEGVKVEVKDAISIKGHIREIGIMRTKVTSEDGRIYVLPNRTFQNAVFSIMSTRTTG